MPIIRIDLAVYFLLALGLLVLPLPWLSGAILGAVFHELCHYVAAHMKGIRCQEIHVRTGGIYMRLPPMDEKAECQIALAGPMGSLLLLIFLRAYPPIAICGAVQGLFNLIPVYPFDGGRVVKYLLRGHPRIRTWIEGIVCGILIWFGIWLGIGLEWGSIPIICSIYICFQVIHRKFPCKEGKIGVQ